MPVISVITPAFNAASTILRAIQSVEDQNFPDWEHIIVDDGSTDQTAALISAIASPRLELIRSPNRGIGPALNTGIARATGNYIAILDSDDEYLPRHLELHLSEMMADPSLDLLWGGLDLITSSPDQALVPDMVRRRGYIHVQDCVVQGTLFVRRRVFSAIRFTEDRNVWCPDFDFYSRVEAAGFRCHRFSQPTYRYYRDSGSSVVDRVKATWPVSGEPYNV